MKESDLFESCREALSTRGRFVELEDTYSDCIMDGCVMSRDEVCNRLQEFVRLCGEEFYQVIDSVWWDVAECGESIPEARRKAIAGVRLCIVCQTEHDKSASTASAYNRRGSKDSQLR